MKYTKTMSSLASFIFRLVDLHTVTINGNPWTGPTEVSKAIRNGEKSKIAIIVKKCCSKKNFTHEYQMSSVNMVYTAVDWPKNSQKYVLYLNKLSMNYYFRINCQKQKTSTGTALMCCFFMFGSSSQTR